MCKILNKKFSSEAQILCVKEGHAYLVLYFSSQLHLLITYGKICWANVRLYIRYFVGCDVVNWECT